MLRFLRRRMAYKGDRPMPIRFRCPCGQKLKSPNVNTGKRAQCPKCRTWLRIPESYTYDAVARPADEGEEKASAPLSQGTAEHAPARAEAASGGHKAVVVAADGDPAELEALSVMLREHGYHVHGTNDGDQAVALIREHGPDAAVLDIHLQNLAGFQVVKQISDPANAANKNVWTMPVIMTSPKVRGRDKQYALSLGVKGFFGKPLTPARLCHRLEREIGKYRARAT